jgi:hypothetical protein
MKTLLLPPNQPFIVPRTEKVEGQQYPVEGLVDDAYLYLQPCLGKEAYNSKKYYDKSSVSFEIAKGLFKDKKLFCIPKSPVDLHGDIFCFNRPKTEDDDTASKAQNEILKKWAKHCCITVIECSEHHYLNKLATEFDGYFLPEQDISIKTEPTKFDELPNTEQKKFEELKDKLKEGNNYDDLVDDDSVGLSLQKRGLLVNLEEKEPRISASKMLRFLNDDIIEDDLPSEMIALEDYASKFNPPKSSGGYSKGKGGGYYSPEQRLEFITTQLKKAGFKTDSPYAIMYDAMSDPIKWLALQFVLNVSGSYTPNWELPNLEGLKELPETEPEPEPEPEPKQTPQPTNNEDLKEWVKGNKDKLYGQGFDSILEGEVTVSKEWEQLWLAITQDITPWDTETKRKIKEVTGKSLTKKSGGWLGLDIEDLKTIQDNFCTTF